LIAAENFETMPAWNSSYEGGLGIFPAVWSIQPGGDVGNHLESTRDKKGSSSKVNVYTVPANTEITVSVSMRCPEYTSRGDYWMESAFRLGNHTAQDFEENVGSWTMIQRFSDTGINGNANTWTRYSVQVNTGANTEISIGYKLGTGRNLQPIVGWDTLRIQEALLLGYGPKLPDDFQGRNPAPMWLFSLALSDGKEAGLSEFDVPLGRESRHNN
jgi:hypothetical protein